MRLQTSTMPSPHQIHFVGSEAWLARISLDLSPKAPEESKIQGDISLRLDSAGFVHATGSVSAEATRPCDRCGQAVKIPLHSHMDVTFRPPFTDVTPRIMALTSEDLEVYFIEDGAVDLEVMINDSIQCAIPSQIGCSPSDITICGSSEDSLVRTEEDRHQMDLEASSSASHNPFLALKEQLAAAKNIKKS